jgi:hypothetical protein
MMNIHLTFKKNRDICVTGQVVFGNGVIIDIINKKSFILYFVLSCFYVASNDWADCDK